jgi:hypothetical protein
MIEIKRLERSDGQTLHIIKREGNKTRDAFCVVWNLENQWFDNAVYCHTLKSAEKVFKRIVDKEFPLHDHKKKYRTSNNPRPNKGPDKSSQGQSEKPMRTFCIAGRYIVARSRAEAERKATEEANINGH